MRVRPFRSEVAGQILRQQTRGLPGTVGVFVTDMISGRWASLNPFAPFYGASTVKVLIAMTVLRLVDQGRLTLWETIAYQPSDYQAGTGILLGSIRPGDRITVERLLDLMITVSDNIARNMLERFIGSGTIRQYSTTLGVTPPYERAGSTTPYGMNQVLLALDTGRSGLTEESTRRLLGWMERTVHRSRIPRYLPPDVTVANKIGTWPGQAHDVGIVYAPDKSFTIAVFTRGIPEAQAEEVIGRIAQAMYRYEESLTA